METNPPQEAPASKTPSADVDEDTSYRQDILAQIEQAWLKSEGETETTPETPAEETRDSVTGENPEVAAKEGIAAGTSEYEGTVHLDILPPLTPSQLVEIQKYLRAWPGIGITELAPNNNGYSITLVIQKPIQLIDILKQLPEVDEANESTAEADKGEKRIQITVSKKK
jgi:hypothetical protein